MLPAPVWSDAATRLRDIWLVEADATVSESVHKHTVMMVAAVVVAAVVVVNVVVTVSAFVALSALYGGR